MPQLNDKTQAGANQLTHNILSTLSAFHYGEILRITRNDKGFRLGFSSKSRLVPAATLMSALFQVEDEIRQKLGRLQFSSLLAEVGLNPGSTMDTEDEIETARVQLTLIEAVRKQAEDAVVELDREIADLNGCIEDADADLQDWQRKEGVLRHKLMGAPIRGTQPKTVRRWRRSAESLLEQIQLLSQKAYEDELSAVTAARQAIIGVRPILVMVDLMQSFCDDGHLFLKINSFMEN